MITLKEACAIAKCELENEKMYVSEECTDLGDSWCFIAIPKDEFERMYYTGGDVLKISKETGEMEYVYVGLPGQEFFDRWISSKSVDISEYLKELADD